MALKKLHSRSKTLTKKKPLNKQFKIKTKKRTITTIGLQTQLQAANKKFTTSQRHFNSLKVSSGKKVKLLELKVKKLELELQRTKRLSALKNKIIRLAANRIMNQFSKPLTKSKPKKTSRKSPLLSSRGGKKMSGNLRKLQTKKLTRKLKASKAANRNHLHNRFSTLAA